MTPTWCGSKKPAHRSGRSGWSGLGAIKSYGLMLKLTKFPSKSATSPWTNHLMLSTACWFQLRKKHRQGSHLTKLYHQQYAENKLSLVINLLQLAMEAMAHFVDSAFHHFPWKYPAASDPTESWMRTM